MNIYLDDDLSSPLLAVLLRRAGHDVERPQDVNLAGQSDPTHLAHAIRRNRVMLSGNHDDFKELHDLLMAGSGHHPGILIVRRDNDPTKDMKPPTIVRAIRNLEAAGFATADAFEVLNHWR